MNIAKVEELVQQVLKDFSQETFIYDLLAAYGKPKASITRLQKGNLNLSKNPGEIVWKKNLLFRALDSEWKISKNEYASVVQEEMRRDYDLHVTIDQLRKSDQVAKHDLRFVVVTDYKTLLAVDTKNGDTLDIPIKELPKHFDFFLPWTGQEKHKSHTESQADIKAAYRMAKLYDEICKENPGMDANDRHSLNVFLSRILFCFFAEDTEIFPKKGMFTSSIASHTQEDGSDLDSYLDKLFDAMNKEDRSSYPAYIEAFPYVNGGLFANKIKSPKFSRQARKILVECGELDWSEINPDIFGSMMQAVVHPEQRSAIGMHYTSVSNIMKAIEPLFLNELREVFEDNADNVKGLKKLLERLYNIKIFDPACGSGNFLIISYKELRNLEMQIYERLRDIDDSKGVIFLPKIRLTQFYGIEIDDFAHEIAILSLWLAEHQMNVKFKDNFGQVVPPLPLKEGGSIVCGNATRLEWENVCPKITGDEIFVLGNPPYLGTRNQKPIHKSDMAFALSSIRNFKTLDYIACWFFKGADYIRSYNAKLAFVSTNSICQGDQVAIMWPDLLKSDLEINFAHQAFNWNNNAKRNAGVTCIVIGIRNRISDGKKYIYNEGSVTLAKNINCYLVNGSDAIIGRRSTPISPRPIMIKGSIPADGGHLLLTQSEYIELKTIPGVEAFLKRFIGATEFIDGVERWCLFIEDKDLEQALKIRELKKRLEGVSEMRKSSTKAATKQLAQYPHKFAELRYNPKPALIVPCTTSERRSYLPIGFCPSETVVYASAQAIYAPEPWVFGIIASRLHNIWVHAVAGRLRTDVRYSSSICYNNFPIPHLGEKEKESLGTHAFDVLAERERHPEKTIAQLYDPEKMPTGLLKAHHDLDAAVERYYRSRPFTSDEERLEYLFKLYEEMTNSIGKKTHA